MYFTVIRGLCICNIQKVLILSVAVEHSFWTFNICFSFVYELLKAFKTDPSGIVVCTCYVLHITVPCELYLIWSLPGVCIFWLQKVVNNVCVLYYIYLQP